MGKDHLPLNPKGNLSSDVTGRMERTKFHKSKYTIYIHKYKNDNNNLNYSK